MLDDELRLAIYRVQFPNEDPEKLSSRVNLYGKKYPTDISSAWELVEEMRQAGSFVGVECRGDDPLSPFNWEWRCCYQISRTQMSYEYAATAPRAICEAWLMWKKGQG